MPLSLRLFKNKLSEAILRARTQKWGSRRRLQKKESKRTLLARQFAEAIEQQRGLDAEAKSIDTIPFPTLPTVEEEDETLALLAEVPPEMPQSIAQEAVEESGSPAEEYTSETSIPEPSIAPSRLYSDAEEMDFALARDAIMDYTAADNQLSAAQLADIHKDMDLLRSNYLSQYAKSSTNLLLNASSMGESSRIRRYPTPDTDDDESNEILSPVSSSYITACSSIWINDQSEVDNSSFLHLPGRFINGADASSSQTRSTYKSYQTAQSTLSKFKQIIDETLASNRNSTSSSNLANSSSTLSDSLPTPSTNTTGQTTPLFGPELGRRYFTLDEVIDIDQHLQNRKTGMAQNQPWADDDWGFEALQRFFIHKYSWKPDVERFEDFWLRREERVDFWLLWDYPTNLV